MSTRSNSSNLFSSLRYPESLIRRRNLGEPSSLFDFEEVMSIPHNNIGPPPAGPSPPNNNGPPPVVRPNGHIDKFLEITQHMKQNGVSDDALRLSLFPYSLTHHAIAWYDRLPRNSIHSFDDMMRKFLSKYFPPSMVTKLRNEIMKFEQKPHESLFEAWERYKLSIDRCPNHNMLLVTQIDTFYNGLTLSHRDTINAAAGGTFMQKTPKECYELIENITAHHNHWDNSATRDETSRNISSTSTTESPEVVRQLEMMNKNFVEMMRQIQTVKTVDTKCETCGGPHSLSSAQPSVATLKRPLMLLRLDECLALADLGASINLMPLSVWKQLSLPKLTSTRMILELADQSTVHPKGVAEVDFVKVGKFYFPADFIVVDYDVDPRVPLILGRPFLRTTRALIGVYDVACEEYAQEVLGFLDSSLSGNPIPSDPIIASSSPSFTPFEGRDFILEEIETFLHTSDELSNLDDDYYDTEGDILYLEKLLNKDPSPILPPMKNVDLKQIDVTIMKPSIEEPPKLELKDLPSHLEYAFLEGTDKLPIIISKELKDEEKAALLKVLKSHKRAIAWKISNIKAINPSFCTHKILMEDDFKPVVQHQRRVNPKIHKVIKKEVIKLLDAELIYPISDSPWVSPVHCVPKKGGITVIENEENKLIPTRCMIAIFHDMIEETMEVFMDDFSVFGDSFLSCLSNLDKMLKRYQDTNLVLNWEKCHFMVKEGIVLGHKILKSGIEVDRAKVDVIAKLPHSTTVKGVRSFLGHAGFYHWFIQDFSKISRPMTHLLEKETPFVFSKECIEAFNILKKKLTKAPILVAPDWDLPFEIMCDAGDYAVGAVLGQRKTKYFQPIHYANKTMTDAQAHYTTTEKRVY
ncbi:reverse transcriptase domain-containing protein [Tanacetum coccineum]